MTILQAANKMDIESEETVVRVHSPVIQFSSNGSYFTSYVISLKASDPSFTLSYSHVRRRYSEFVHLRKLLKAHHHTMEPPFLPPKSYFHRFNNIFIEERKAGLEKFLQEVLSIPVYLSDKSVHLFLQSIYSMSEIKEQCFGDVPAPQLVEQLAHSPVSSFHSDSSSTTSSSGIETIEVGTDVAELSFDPSKTNRTSAIHIDHDGSNHPILKKRKLKNSSPDNSDNFDSANSSLESNLERHVSFNDNVMVAIVRNHMWDINVRPIKNGG